MTTPEKLKVIRRASGLTQEKLAAELGVSFVAFNNWITGKSMPRKGAAERIDALYRKYTGEKKISPSVLAGKKAALTVKRRKYPTVLREILSRPNAYDEFLLELTYNSNRIEGSTLTENETAAIIFKNVALPNKSLIEQLEARNHRAALEYLFGRLKEKKPITEEFVLQLHRILLNGIDSSAGSYRKHNVRILGANVPTANYVKVPEKMKALMKDVRYAGRDVIAQAAETHSRFEQIHPFSDGNGRVGRLLMNAVLLRSNFPPAVISAKKRPLYFRYLNEAQIKGDNFSLEDFLCDAVLEGYELLEG